MTDVLRDALAHVESHGFGDDVDADAVIKTAAQAQLDGALTVPAFGVNPDLDKMLYNVFITAVEGGIDYWIGYSSSYHLYVRGSEGDVARPEDHNEFSVTIHLEDPFGPGELKLTIDRSTIVDGFVRLAQGPVEYMPEGQRLKFLTMLHARLAGLSDHVVDIDYDAGDADNLVQAGLFGKVIFG